MSIDLVLPRAYVTPSTEGAANAAYTPYTRIPDAVLLDPRLTPGQLRIYAVIARRADREKASAFPSYATIANDAHVSRTSAINGVKVLVTFGYLAKQVQESGQGDPTSNLYIISGAGSQIFVLPRTKTTTKAEEAVQKLDCGSAEFVPQVVQPLDHGGANFGPELDSLNEKQENKIQENRSRRAQPREAAAATAAVDPELQELLNDFQENIGALTGMAQDVTGQLAEKYSAEWVRDAIQEAVIYEKRSLAYVRRVLEAWKRNGRETRKTSSSTSTSEGIVSDFPASDLAMEEEFIWPPDLKSDLPLEPDMTDPAVAAWEAISREVPQLGRFKQTVTPVSLIDNVLTVTVPDSRTHNALTWGLSSFMACATRKVLGNGDALMVELAGESERLVK